MKKILIADDNYEFSISLLNQLNQLEIDKTISIATDGKKVLNDIINNNIDLILLDLDLPNLTGLEILKILKEKKISIDVIVISGEQNMIIEIIKNNIDIKAYFMKPFNVDDLINKIYYLNDRNEKNCSNYKNIINSILDQFNFNKCSSGYNYIIDCILLCINNNYEILPRNKIIYSEISKKYNMSNYFNVEWNITKCIKSMIKVTDSKIIADFFKYDFNPSTRTFLSTILDITYKQITLK